MIRDRTFDIPAEMMTALAVGLDPPFTIAERYGFTFEEWVRIQGSDWYVRALDVKRKELEAQGFTFRGKMGMLAEDMLIEVYKSAMASDSLSLKIEAAKYLTKVADLEPKPNASSLPPGERFSLRVVFSNANPSTPDASLPQSATIELTANPSTPVYLDPEVSPPPAYMATSSEHAAVCNMDLTHGIPIQSDGADTPAP